MALQTGRSTLVVADQGRSWYYGWNVVAATIASQIAANALLYNCFSLFVRSWSIDLRTPVSQIQLCVTALAMLCACMAPLIGTLADKYPARRLLVLGLTGIVIFYTAVSFVTTGWQLIALYGLLAPLALSFSASLITNPLISRWFVHRLGIALGLSSFGFGLAGVFLPTLISTMLPAYGWRLIWRIAAAIVAIVAVPLMALVVRDRPTVREGLHYVSAGTGLSHAPEVKAEAGAMRWREVLARRNFWLLVGIYLPIMGTYGSITQNLVPYAMSQGFSQKSVGPLLSLLSLAHIAATLVLGYCSDRFGNRRPFAALGAVVAVGVIMLAALQAPAAVVIGCMFVGCGGGYATLLSAALVREYGANKVGQAFGLSMFFIPFGALLPAAIAKMQETTGSYLRPLLGLVLLLLISVALSSFLKEKASIGHARGIAPQH